MSHYVLVHGAWEEGAMWDHVSPILKSHNHTVTAIDLPGHGANRGSDPAVTTELYIEALIDVINRLDSSVVLVGHSMNGALISNVAERIPEKIERLVYVTAFLLRNGDNVFDTMAGDTDAEVFSEIEFTDDQAFATLPEPALRRVGLHDVDDTEIQRILPFMAEWQSSEPFLAKVVLSERNFGSIPKTYIRTTLDRMISPRLQSLMIENWNVDSVFEITSGHFPTSSKPAELADALLKAALIGSEKIASNA